MVLVLGGGLLIGGRDYIQELWMQQAPPPNVVVDGGNTPVIRMDTQDAHQQGFHVE